MYYGVCVRPAILENRLCLNCILIHWTVLKFVLNKSMSNCLLVDSLWWILRIWNKADWQTAFRKKNLKYFLNQELNPRLPACQANTLSTTSNYFMRVMVVLNKTNPIIYQLVAGSELFCQLGKKWTIFNIFENVQFC